MGVGLKLLLARIPLISFDLDKKWEFMCYFG